MTCVQNGNTNGYCPQWAYDAKTNHITTTGCTYDAAGNMTADCSSTDNHSYQWDGEGRVASVDNGSTWTFTYDARGERVQLTSPSGTEYLAYDVAGNFIMAFGLANYDIVRWGGGMFSIYTPTGTDFNHVNNLSSTMMYTNQAGTPVEDMMFYPWGQVWESWGTGGYNYAGIPYRDLSTTTDLSAFRNLSPGLGRWLSPDPVAGDITNPQSLNRYPYVLNNPTTLIDPLGLQNCRPPAAQMGSGVCVGNVLQITSAVMGWGLVGGYSAWDEFGLMGIPVYAGVVSVEGWIVGANQVGWASGLFIFSQSFGLFPTFKSRHIWAPPSTACTGAGRGLSGNTDLVGRAGGIPGQTVQLDTAAVIPSQFGSRGGAGLSPFAPYINGTIGNASFSAVTDVIGGKPPAMAGLFNVREGLQYLYPGEIILEIPGAPDQGANAPVIISVPQPLGCPEGTSPAEGSVEGVSG